MRFFENLNHIEDYLLLADVRTAPAVALRNNGMPSAQASSWAFRWAWAVLLRLSLPPQLRPEGMISEF